MFKWLFLFAALFPGLAVSGLNSGATITWLNNGREFTLTNTNNTYWWKHNTSANSFRRFYEADLDTANQGTGSDPTGHNGFLLKFPSSWTPSPGYTITWGDFKFYTDNGMYKHDWPKITNICNGCEFSVNAPYATNPVTLTFTSTQADGNYNTTIEVIGAWAVDSSGLPPMPTKYTNKYSIDYYVRDGKVYRGDLATSCDITNPDLEINFGNVPPGTNTIENKTTRLNIQCNDSPAYMRLSIQGDTYNSQWATKRGEVADLYLTLGDCNGTQAHTCEVHSSSGGWDMPLHAKIDTKNKAGAFEGHFVVTVEIS